LVWVALGRGSRLREKEIDPRDEERIMARVIVTPDEETDVVLLDERVYPVHLENKLSSLQVIERLAWAVDDAEATGQPRTKRRTHVPAQS
jgi:hypothetical protein